MPRYNIFHRAWGAYQRLRIFILRLYSLNQHMHASLKQLFWTYFSRTHRLLRPLKPPLRLLWSNVVALPCLFPRSTWTTFPGLIFHLQYNWHFKSQFHQTDSQSIFKSGWVRLTIWALSTQVGSSSRRLTLFSLFTRIIARARHVQAVVWIHAFGTAGSNQTLDRIARARCARCNVGGTFSASAGFTMPLIPISTLVGSTMPTITRLTS